MNMTAKELYDHLVENERKFSAELLPNIILLTEGRERELNMTLRGSVYTDHFLVGHTADEITSSLADAITHDIRLRTNAMQDMLDSPDPYTRDVGSMFFRSAFDVENQRTEFRQTFDSISYTVYFRVLLVKRTQEYTDVLRDRYAAEDLLHKAGLYLHAKRMRVIRDAVSSGEWPSHVAAALELISRHQMITTK